MNKISKEMGARLRVMYAMDLATRWGSAQATMKALFNDGLNPEWIKMKDVFKDPSDIDFSKENYGCFKVRKTEKSYIISIDLARIPIIKTHREENKNADKNEDSKSIRKNKRA